jgi:hypothetical protein
MADQKQTNAPQSNSMGQVKDQENAHGRRLSEQQDVGELSAQNRGGTTGRGLEETKRLEQDDRESPSASQNQRDILDTTDETCDASAELNEIFAEEDRKAAAPRKPHPGQKADQDVPGIGHSKADAAEEEALNRDTESYVDEAQTDEE